MCVTSKTNAEPYSYWGGNLTTCSFKVSYENVVVYNLNWTPSDQSELSIDQYCGINMTKYTLFLTLWMHTLYLILWWSVTYSTAHVIVYHNTKLYIYLRILKYSVKLKNYEWTIWLIFLWNRNSKTWMSCSHIICFAFDVKSDI